MAKIGYQRVSTTEQHLDRQEDAMAGLAMDRVFSDKASGSNTDRPGLRAMLDFAREGDVIYVESISRLARSVRDLLSIVEQLETKGVGFVSLKESIDTGSPAGRFVLTIFAALAQLERETIHQRQREGIEAARARGRMMGRPRATCPAEWSQVITEWRAGRITAAAAMRTLSMKKTTFYKLVKQHQASHQERVAS